MGFNPTQNHPVRDCTGPQNAIGLAEPVKTTIRPSSGRIHLGLGEIWQYRDLLYILIWRDIKIRYKQTVIGAAWAILQPLMTMVVFSVIFGRLARIPSEGIPYPIFAYCALVPWTYFTHALTKTSTSMVENYGIFTKIYFPRLIIPLAAVLAAFVDFVIAFVVLLGLMLYFGMVPTIAIVTLPFFSLLAIATALAVGLWLATLNVQYRDVANAIPFLSQIWLFATPVAYPSSMIPDPWRTVYGLNPMAGVVEGFRWALLGSSQQPPGPLLYVSCAAVFVLLVGGTYFFRSREDTFADVV